VAFLIGTDEAGYGPNLGPLTIGGTLWQVPETAVDLYEVLKAVVASRRQTNRLVVADSKQVYQSGQSIERLERTVLAFLHLASDAIPTSFHQLGGLLGGEPEELGPGYAGVGDIALPLCAKRSDIESDSARLRRSLAAAGCALQGCRVATIFPSRFNSAVEKLGNKAELLSSETLQLAGQLLTERPEGDESDILIGCDKHGGRSKYAGMLNQYLTDEFVKIERETMELSQYEWEWGGAAVSICFQARGEKQLPIALASMLAKYVREVAMLGWNHFWQQKLPGIKPTQGYPVDARRFKKEIAELQRNLGIDDHLIWRSR